MVCAVSYLQLFKWMRVVVDFPVHIRVHLLEKMSDIE